MTGVVHIVGAGLAGLSAAVEAARRGRQVKVYESAPRAGGRCRSFHDDTLDAVIDNGSHAIVGANTATLSYLDSIGASDRLVAANQSGDLPFFDVPSGERWSIRPGQIGPLWIFSKGRRPPHTSVGGFLQGLRLLWASNNNTVRDMLDPHDPAWSRFWHPLCTAVMNTHPETASARLLGQAVRKIGFSGKGGLKTYVPRVSLDDTFVTPALEVLKSYGGHVAFNSPLKEIRGTPEQPVLSFRDHETTLDKSDCVIVSTPPWVNLMKRSLDKSPSKQPVSSAIVNCHFKFALSGTQHHTDVSAEGGVIGLIGGTAEWIFIRPNLISVTVSAANALAERPSADIARALWSDVCAALGLADSALPSHRVIVEKRATPAQTPTFVLHRISHRTRWPNVLRAGDWVDTGLPCTLESAILSGREAARLAMNTRE